MISFRSGKQTFLLQFRFQRGKGLDDPHHVLVRADAAGVKQKRMVDQIALRQELPVGLGGVSAQKAFVDRVVHHFDAVGGNGEQLLHFALGEVGDGENSRRSLQRPVGQVKMQRALQP